MFNKKPQCAVILFPSATAMSVDHTVFTGTEESEACPVWYFGCFQLAILTPLLTFYIQRSYFTTITVVNHWD